MQGPTTSMIQEHDKEEVCSHPVSIVFPIKAISVRQSQSISEDRPVRILDLFYNSTMISNQGCPFLKLSNSESPVSRLAKTTTTPSQSTLVGFRWTDNFTVVEAIYFKDRLGPKLRNRYNCYHTAEEKTNYAKANQGLR